MNHFIQLLPESVANQIAAGEVVQRPASVVKELLENSVDAGALSISLILREAGKNLIQVIDNGCGMSADDARLSFERHATSKIREAADLFSLHTFGFRGEALPSIASVAEVIMETRRKEDELGLQIRVAASEADPAEPVHCPAGTQISVKNLFFNTPARRRFLKGNATELKHIINEFQRVALTHPEIAFSLHHNQQEIYHLPAANCRQRIVQLFGKQINANLVPVNADTQVVKISGFIAKPEYAKKSSGEQFFFVNGRFIRSPFLHKAVTRAYDELLGQELYPTYFLYLEVDPEALDVNIHPTKTEVKFEHEQPVFQIMYAAVRAGLGKFNIIPSIDFDEDTSVDIPVLRPGTHFTPPETDIDPYYNPFESHSKESYHNGPDREFTYREEAFENSFSTPLSHSDPLLQEEDAQNNLLFRSGTETADTPLIKNHWIQLKNRYILTTVKSGVMVIDQKRAHERILYEQFLQKFSQAESQPGSRTLLYPVALDLTPEDFFLFEDICEDLCRLGFAIRVIGKLSVVIEALPADGSQEDPETLFRSLLSDIRTSGNLSANRAETLAKNAARAGAVSYGKALHPDEISSLIDHLFACESPGISPTGKPTITIIRMEEIDNKF